MTDITITLTDDQLAILSLDMVDPHDWVQNIVSSKLLYLTATYQPQAFAALVAAQVTPASDSQHWIAQAITGGQLKTAAQRTADHHEAVVPPPEPPKP